MFRILFCTLLLLPGLPVTAAENAVSATMVPLEPNLQPDEVFSLAVVLSMSDGWHTYWRNPGEAGLATSFDWQLPSGFRILEKREPVPVRYTSAGITTLIHQDEAIYIFKLQAPAELTYPVELSLTVDWLECREICRPGSAVLTTVFPRDQQQDPEPEELIDLVRRAESMFPLGAWPWPEDISLKRGRVQIDLSATDHDAEKILSAVFYPFAGSGWDMGGNIKVINKRRGPIIQVPLDPDRSKNPERIHGIMELHLDTDAGPRAVKALIDKPIL